MSKVIITLFAVLFFGGLVLFRQNQALREDLKQERESHQVTANKYRDAFLEIEKWKAYKVKADSLANKYNHKLPPREVEKYQDDYEAIFDGF